MARSKKPPKKRISKKPSVKKPSKKSAKKPSRKTSNAPSKKKTASLKYELRLYIVGKTPHGIAAFTNLKKICEDNFPAGYGIEVIDLLQYPHLAKEDRILAIPTVIRKLPRSSYKAIGDLSNAEAVLAGLNLPSKSKLKAI